jgi:hypothetical protein
MYTQSSEYLSTAEAAVYLHVSRKFLETARCCGDGPCFFKVGRSVRYNRADLDAFMMAHQRTKTDNGHDRADLSGISLASASTVKLACASRKRGN